MSTSNLSTPRDLFTISHEALERDNPAAQGEGLQIVFGDGPTPFGQALIAWTKRGICHLGFHHESRTKMHQLLAQAWPRARWARDDKTAAHMLADIFMPGHREQHAVRRFHLLIKGTEFQLQVWRALLATHMGDRLSYGELATRLEHPHAARAVGSAVGANTIAYLIPCHRVIREDGAIGQYRWGAERKAALLAHETPVVQKAVDDS